MYTGTENNLMERGNECNEVRSIARDREECKALRRIELKSIWVRALQGPMHLGLQTGPLCPILFTRLYEPCSFNKVPDGPHT